jgi:hypothetical protein
MGMAKQKRRAGATRSKGKSKTVAKKQARADASKMAKRSSKKATKTLSRKVTRGTATRKRSPKQKQLSAPNPLVETEILEIVEEPVSGIVTVTEIESVHVTMPDSAEETKTTDSPPEEGMAA